MNCLSWNIRGMGKGENLTTITNLVVKNKISFLGLIEIKHRRSLKFRMRRIWGHDEYELCEIFASETYGGGLATAWDPGIFNVSRKHMGARWILLEGCNKEIIFECCVGLLYAPNDRVARNVVFEELKLSILSINKSVLLLGDFNVILHPEERVGSF